MVAKSNIYILADPRDGAVRYVGQTVEPKERFRAHLSESTKGSPYRCHRWIASLSLVGLIPAMEIIEEVPRESADMAEMSWIKHYRSLGASLTNHTDGGGGFRGHKPSQESILKRAAALRGKPRSAAAKAAIKAGLNRPETRELRRQASIGNKSRLGQRQTDEEKLKRAETNRGKKRSPEFCEFLRKKATGVRHSKETRKKISESKRSRLSPERRSEIARIGNLASQEAKRWRSHAE